MRHAIDKLFSNIVDRKNADPSVSYTAKLLDGGTNVIAQKVGEEAVETIIEAVSGSQDSLIHESADLLYHLMVLWADADINLQSIWDELDRRSGRSGIEEKAGRP
jgi:phosphoribosyl-ATP pyrophosphohydrolase